MLFPVDTSAVNRNQNFTAVWVSLKKELKGAEKMRLKT